MVSAPGPLHLYETGFLRTVRVSIPTSLLLHGNLNRVNEHCLHHFANFLSRLRILARIMASSSTPQKLAKIPSKAFPISASPYPQLGLSFLTSLCPRRTGGPPELLDIVFFPWAIAPPPPDRRGERFPLSVSPPSGALFAPLPTKESIFGIDNVSRH
jgi:hypothetical protein